MVELLGSERLIWFLAGSARVAVRVPASVRTSPREHVTVAMDPAGVRFFDPDTGLLLRRPGDGHAGR